MSYRDNEKRINHNQTEIFETSKEKPKWFSKVKVIIKEIQWGDILTICAPVVSSTAANLVCNCLVAGVGRYGIASTGTPISSLHGVSRYNAIMPHFGGGTLANGGGGIAKGEAVIKMIHTSVQTSVQVGFVSCGAIYNFNNK